MDAWQLIVILGAGLLAGAVNAIAGAGSLITFPTLLWVGIGPVIANATNTVALWPGLVSATYGYRNELRPGTTRFLWLVIPSLIGGTLGAGLLLNTPAHSFAVAAPFLVLFATVLVAVRDAVTRWGNQPSKELDPDRRWWAIVVPAQFLIAVYGGYFGAGIGILMLGTMGFMGFENIHQMNTLKAIFAFSINGAALVYFIAAGIVDWAAATVMAIGAISGGFLSSKAAYRVGQDAVRSAVVVIGLLMGLSLLVRLYV